MDEETLITWIKSYRIMAQAIEEFENKPNEITDPFLKNYRTKLIEDYKKKTTFIQSRLYRITEPIEQTILLGMLEGKSEREISRLLGVSHNKIAPIRKRIVSRMLIT